MGGDTAHSNLGHLIRCSNKGEDNAQKSKMFEKQRGGGQCTFRLRLYGQMFKIGGGQTFHLRVSGKILWNYCENLQIWVKISKFDENLTFFLRFSPKFGDFRENLQI